MAPLTRGGRLFDLVVWGSTGFTGRLIVEYLCRAIAREHPKLRWAIAGRDKAKAEAVKAWALARAGPLPPGAQEPAVLVGDARDQGSVDRIIGETRVILAAAGPFWTHGAPVVDACVRLGAGALSLLSPLALTCFFRDVFSFAPRAPDAPLTSPFTAPPSRLCRHLG